MYLGCNIENSSYDVTMCAERVALFSAIAAGERNLAAIALVADTDEPLSPCGACRQVIAELAPAAKIVLANSAGDAFVTSIDELLPRVFNLTGGERKRDTN
jgi:cytidine deaminase